MREGGRPASVGAGAGDAPGGLVDEAVVIGDERLVIRRPRDDEPLVREAVARGDEDPSYWARMWPTARAMGSWVLRSGVIGPGVRALEIGCGLGLVGICAARRGATVVMTDRDERGVELARWNAARNGVEGEVVRFDWREPAPAGWRFDVVLGSDVLYRDSAHDEIARLLLRLGERGECLGVLADPNRRSADGACAAFERHGLRVWVTPIPGGRLLLVQR